MHFFRLRTAIIDRSRYWLWIGTLLLFPGFFLLAIQTSFPFALILVLAVPLAIAFFYYAVKIPGLIIGLMIAATSLDVMGRITPKGAAIPITVFHLVFFLALLVLIFKKIWQKDLSVRATGVEWPLLLFLFWITITIFWSQDQEEGLISLARLVALVIAMYTTLNLVESKAGLRLIVILTLIPALGLSSYAAYNFLTASAVEVKNALSMLKLFSRFGATFEDPNYFATFLLLPLCLVFSSLAFLAIPYWKRIVLFLIPGGVFLIAFVGTFSRSAWVALAVSWLFIFIYFKHKRYWALAGGVFILLAIFIFFQTAFFQSFWLRFASIFEGKTDPSTATRFFLIQGGIQMFFDSYGFGVGFESFPWIYPQYMPPNQALSYVHESHTLPIEILAETGWLGLSMFGFMIYRTFQIGLTSIRQTRDNFFRTMQIGLVAYLLGLLINFLFMPGGILNNLFWIGMGSVFSIAQLIQSPAEADSLLTKS